jgi:hypothetical protein
MERSGLAHLARASNKATVLKAFNRAFINREQRPENQSLLAYMSDFNLSESAARELVSALQALIKPILYTGDVSKSLDMCI